MANYVAHYTKKLQICKCREEALRRLLASGTAAEEKLLRAAHLVRDARVRVLKARRATLPPAGQMNDKFAAIDAKIQAAEAVTECQILDEFAGR